MSPIGYLVGNTGTGKFTLPSVGNALFIFVGRAGLSKSTLFSRVRNTTILKFVGYAGCGKTTLFSMVGIAVKLTNFITVRNQSNSDWNHGLDNVHFVVLLER